MKNPLQPRIERRHIHGMLLLDKALGASSNHALQKVKRLYRAEKAGHTGTLDPLATGLLPLCLGAATKFAQVALDADKTYRATLQLGQTTASGDAEGEITRTRAVNADRAALQKVCEQFTGNIEQMPPMHSALKHQGKALYEYARQGLEVARQSRPVCIRRLEVISGQDDVWTLDVTCSKGTYIRTLAADMGEALGCGAHLKALHRTASGALQIDQAHTLEALADLTELERDACLLSVDALITHWPIVRLADGDAARFLTGLRRRVDQADAKEVRVYGPQPKAFLGSAHITAGELIPTRLLSPLEVQNLISEVL
jgi:tRNA pseudouridine55 synthase